MGESYVKMSYKRAKDKLVEQFGGACQVCGYNRCTRALQFHHKDASEKDLWSKSGRASILEIRAHPERFTLLCANCHFEEHDRLDDANRIVIECQSCGRPFQTTKSRIDLGKGKYCRKRCQHDLRSKMAPDTLERRFLDKVEKTDTCWIWAGYHTKSSCFIQTKDPRGGCRPKTAQRVSWELYNGAIPEGMEVLQDCGNYLCVFPGHLRLGTRTDVAAKSLRTKQGARGESSPTAKLTEDQVVELRRRYDAGGITQAELAAENGLSQATVSNIINRRLWGHC